MRKIFFAIIVITLIIGGAVIFLLAQKEDSLVVQARNEVQRANEAYLSFQNVVNVIPLLELSSEVKSDFKMEAAYFDIMGNLEPDLKDFSPLTKIRLQKFLNAAKERNSSQLSFDFEKDFSEFLNGAVNIYNVAINDLELNEREADVFEAALSRAKSGIPELAPFSVARNEKTDKYFWEFDRLDNQIKILTSSLEKYSSDEFRSRIEKLRIANEVFNKISRYTFQLFEGKVSIYALDITQTLPEVSNEEKKIIECFKWAPFVPPPECQPAGFMPGKYQTMLIKLGNIYTELIK